MKKLQKLFMAVAAVAGVTACTTDTTEDLGVNLNEGPKTLTLSLDDTRTQLGAKDDNGIYKLTWSVDDKISVNGSASNPLATSEANGTTATFTFENGFGSAPYGIAYPAAEDGKVLFAAEQTYQPASNDGTFSKGAAVMYGYANDLSNVTLKHLTGVLKIGLVVPEEKAGNVQLKSVRISTADRKPIAGLFDIDFATGKITETPHSKYFITCNVEVEKYLSSNPTYIHIAVPAGVYHELYVTVEASEYNEEDGSFTDGIMYATVKAPDSKPLKAGVVREFSSPITFNPINTEEVFVIKDYDSLVAFANAAKAATEEAPVTKDAVFVADVQIPADKTWSSIDAQYYTGTIYGNGHLIDGLTKRIFVNCGATIKGLHLTNVNFTSNNGAIGNLAAFVGVYYGPCITHCSASGTVKLTNFNGDYAVRMGSIVGIIQSKVDVEISHCVNRCNLVATMTTQGGAGSWLSLGGIYGTVSGATGKLTIKDCVNEGDISVTGKVYAPSRTGGIMAYMAAFNEINMENCVNEGNITFSVATLQSSSRTTYVGGLVADISTNSKAYTIKNCRNEGALTVNSSNMNKHLFFGGIVGNALCGTAAGLVVENCTNSAAITVDIDACKPHNNAPHTNFVSAIVGRLNPTAATSVTIKDVTNSGKLSYAGCNVLTNSDSNTGLKCPDNTYTYVRLGSVLGGIVTESGATPTYTFTNWTNSGDVEVTIGNAGLNGTESYFGGLAGDAGNISVTDADFNGTMTVTKSNKDDTYTTYPNAGMFAGSASGTYTGTVGGKFVCGDGSATLSTTELTNDNYTKYLFSNRTLESYAGVTLVE